MEVLLLAPNYYPEKTGIGVSATDCAAHLSSLGHRVRVVTSVPYYPEWKVPENYKGKLIFREAHKGTSVDRLWRYVPESPSTISRIFHELSFALMAAVRSLFVRTDLVICISPPLLLSFLAVIVSRVRRKPVWLYIQDIQPDTAVALGMLTNPVLIWVLRRMERWSYALATRILVLSREMKLNLLAKNVENSKIDVVPTSVEPKEFDCGDREGFRSSVGIKDESLVMYSGNLGEKQGADVIAEVANLLRDDRRVFFLVLGEGAKRGVLIRRIEELGLDNIRVLPLVDRDKLPDALAGADILLSTQRKEIVDVVVPSKLLTYLATGKPIVAAAPEDSSAAHLLVDADAGLVVAPEDASAIGKAILQLIDDPALASRVAQSGFDLVVNRFSHETVRQKRYKPLFDSK